MKLFFARGIFRKILAQKCVKDRMRICIYDDNQAEVAELAVRRLPPDSE